MGNPIQQSIVLLTSVERVATPTVGPDNDYPFLTNHQRFRGAHILLDVTALNSTPDVNIDIEGYDFGSDSFYNILTGGAVTTVSFNIYKVHPDFTADAGLIAKDGLPYLWRVTVTHVDSEGITYTLAVNYLD